MVRPPLSMAERVLQGEGTTVAAALAEVEADNPTDGSVEPAAAQVVRDELGQPITDPEIADAFTFVTERIDSVVALARTASRAWGKGLHQELIDGEKRRIVESPAYHRARELADRELRSLAGQLGLQRPFALCPYCKGKPLAKDRRDYCGGCGGGGWVAKSTWDNAPDEKRVVVAGTEVADE